MHYAQEEQMYIEYRIPARWPISIQGMHTLSR